MSWLERRYGASWEAPTCHRRNVVRHPYLLVKKTRAMTLLELQTSHL